MSTRGSFYFPMDANLKLTWNNNESTVSLTTTKGQSRCPGKSEKVILKKFGIGVRSRVRIAEEARVIPLKQR